MASGIRAVSVTHCGELGFVLYMPNEIANYVYERIVEAGQEYGLMHAGYYALRHLRIEKFYVSSSVVRPFLIKRNYANYAYCFWFKNVS
jgi:glycine cleavage system aminomethyltransferase T